MLNREPSAAFAARITIAVASTVAADTTAANTVVASIVGAVFTALVSGTTGVRGLVANIKAVGSVVVRTSSGRRGQRAIKFTGSRGELQVMWVMLLQGHRAAKIVESRVGARVGKMLGRKDPLFSPLQLDHLDCHGNLAACRLLGPA